ncbi:hypothetical protein [Streptomyces sp. NPDC049744]|uniref:hypothetical protein n=1 Tax=Streptomyces sp. NPDC049744 TaxID=3154359 RepID=UPI003421FBC4
MAGAIGEHWENEHFAPAPGFTPGEGGVRKQLFDSYAASVDWTDHDHVTRALRVFESMLRRLGRESRKYGGDGLPADTVADLREAFARDGCRLDDELRLHTARVAHLVVHADALSRGEAQGRFARMGDHDGCSVSGRLAHQLGRPAALAGCSAAGAARRYGAT